jgi:hypothetical protein
MRVQLPWTGRDINRMVAISGRAAVPGIPSGAGFNWRSMVGNTSGWVHPMALSGLGNKAYRTLRRHGGHRGLGQGDTSGAFTASSLSLPTTGAFANPFSTPSFSDIPSTTTLTAPASSGYVINADGSISATNFAPSLPGAPFGVTSTSPISPIGTSLTASGANSQAPWYAPLIASGLASASQIANYQLNPLYQKSTFYQTPQGTIFASNQPTSGIPGFPSTAQFGSIMPILLIAGAGLVFVMMMAKR